MMSNQTFEFDQSVQGNGYFMNYMYAKVGNLAFKNYAHGSGSIDNSVILTTQKYNNTYEPWDATWTDIQQNCIQFKEDNNMVYSPMRIAIGNGYYAANPIDYSSLLKEKTWVKNYAAANEIQQEIEYAHAITKQLNAVAKENFTNIYDPTYLGNAVTQMQINEDVTDGKIHIGVLQGANTNVAGGTQNGIGYADGGDFMDPAIGAPGLKGEAWRNPAILIDEDYWGTYHLEKNISLEVPYKLVVSSEDWLPCCFGGYSTMNYYDQKVFGKSTKGIFDCTCYPVHNTAQFPEPSETKAW